MVEAVGGMPVVPLNVSVSALGLGSYASSALVQLGHDVGLSRYSGPQAIPLLKHEDDPAPADDVVFHRVSSSVSQSSTASGPWSDPFPSASAWGSVAVGTSDDDVPVSTVSVESPASGSVSLGAVSVGANDSEVEAAGAMWTTYVSEGDLGSGLAGLLASLVSSVSGGVVVSVDSFERSNDSSVFVSSSLASVSSFALPGSAVGTNASAVVL